MAEIELYPKELMGLNLNFTEAIYAITFGLEEEIRDRGKEAVFAEFDLSPGEMKEGVDNCLETLLSSGESYALHRVLGGINTAVDDAKTFGEFGSLEDYFSDAVKKLCSTTVSTWKSSISSWGVGLANPRWLLVKKKKPEVKSCVNNDQPEAGNVGQLYAELQQLAAEAKMYEEKRNSALTRMAELIQQIQQRNDTMEDVLQETVMLDLESRVEQINWPCRSREILRELQLNTLGEVVEYFGNFENFVDGDLTLLEWAVMTSILHKKKLLPDCQEVALDDSIDEIFLSARTYNCLKRAGINDIGDIVKYFADGAEAGLMSILEVRYMGRRSYEDFLQGLSEITIKLDDATCFPTTSSPIQALDFNCEMQGRLRCCYGFDTVGELLNIYHDTNRFTGLQYVDPELYQVTQWRLEKYGLIDAD